MMSDPEPVTASAPKVALACPVCFGALEGRMGDAVSMAVLTLMGVTIAVLAGFASFFLYLVRRARAAAFVLESHEPREGAADRVVEGTAS